MLLYLFSLNLTAAYGTLLLNKQNRYTQHRGKMALVVQVKVVPSSGRQEFKLDKRGFLVCYLKSAPERGLANKELMQLLAKALRLTQAEVSIVSGLTSRLKKVSIAVLCTQEELMIKLGICQQLDIFKGG